MTRNRLLYLALRATLPVIPYAPLSLLYRLASLVSLVAYFLVGPARRPLQENLAVVMDAQPSDPRVKRAARRAFEIDAMNWVDSLRIGVVSRDDLRDLVDIDGWEHVERSIKAGRGLILIAVHLGNIDLVGQVFAAHGLHVTIPVERVQPPELFDLLTRSRRSQGIDVVPVDKAPRAMLRTLRSGQIVAIAGDRSTAGRTLRVPFFGRTTALPSSAAHLARREGAPVAVAAGLRLPDGRFHGIIVPAELQRTEDERADELENTARIAEIMESLIRRHPDQWLAFSPVWSGDNGVDEAARIGHRTDAAASQARWR